MNWAGPPRYSPVAGSRPLFRLETPQDGENLAQTRRRRLFKIAHSYRIVAGNRGIGVGTELLVQYNTKKRTMRGSG
jgi:hypothetical protein